MILAVSGIRTKTNIGTAVKTAAVPYQRLKLPTAAMMITTAPRRWLANVDMY